MKRQTSVPSGLEPGATRETGGAPAARTARAARTASARTAAGRTVNVRLRWRLRDGVLTVIATTLRRGTSYHDSWSISPSLEFTPSTALETSGWHRPRYLSHAAVRDSSLEHDTTYTFSYAIVMRADAHTWAGSGSVIVTVGASGTVSFR